MNCRSCGYQLPQEAKVCPHCGTPVTAYSSDPGTVSSDPTVASYPSRPRPGSSPDPMVAASPSNTPPYLPSTAYGSDPYTPAEQRNRYPPPGSPYPYTPAPFPPPTPYTPPQAGSYPPFPPAGPQGQPPARRFSTGLAVLLIILVVLLIGGSGLIYYITVYNPNQLHTQATATAVVHLTGTAQAQARAQVNATATAVAADPYTHSGILALSDPLSDNSKGVNWAQDPINCGFMGGAYHVKASNANYIDDCLAVDTNYSNFAFEVQMQIIKGDGGGILFRDQDSVQAYRSYALDVYQDGSYNLNMVNGSSPSTLSSGTSTAINQGLNQSNLIAVVANGNTIRLYVNHQQIVSITDSTFSHGKIGFEASPNSSNGHPTEVVFSKAKVWTLA